MTNGILDFDDIGRIPMKGDNAAIAVRRLEAGTLFRYRNDVYTISHTLLEGHRFAVEPIARGEKLLSWALPFGLALRDIEPGEYLCNAGILDALKLRELDFTLPPVANFKDYVAPYELDEAAFRPGEQIALHPQPRTFMGYHRTGGRGAGTRNTIIVLGTTSLTSSFVKTLESRLKGVADKHDNIDGIVAVTHTEGGGQRRPNNLEFVLRTLAGFMVHPNVGAVLAADHGTEVITNAMLEEYLRKHDYPLDHVPHRFYSLERDFESSLSECEATIRGWLDSVNAMAREPRPLSELKIALQCGGSDAFSGVSGNPLAACVAREVIRHGGAAGLAETDELIGAEPWMLANVRNVETARKFLDRIEIFKERVGWHGHSAEGNPSGGNKFRGLYNIAIKSIGAARKKDPDVRLDYAIDYGERMTEPGFYFMDSPGNDLESIAGQVAAGCNMIFFITGNGSITNFPFVPTIKFITTTGRWNLLSHDMDVNAGRYQDGETLEDLGMETFEYTVKVASGTRSVGERAGHSQVSIWRDWRQTDDSRLEELQHHPRPSGEPVTIPNAFRNDIRFRTLRTEHGFAADQVGLIVPTSLCSGQIARMITEDMNDSDVTEGCGISRFVTLVHTEGCGSSAGENEEHYTRTMVGHLVHPYVKEALLLEHGCERTHNDLMRHVLKEYGIDINRFGYASIQLDGGIEKVMEKIKRWFIQQLVDSPPSEPVEAGLEAMSLGLFATGHVPEPAAKSLAWITAVIVGSGGTVVIPENAALLKSADFLEALGLDKVPGATLDYGQSSERQGFHVMASPTDHSVETLSGLGGTGVQLILGHLAGPPLQGHPMIPVIQVTMDTKTGRRFYKDLDCVLNMEKVGIVDAGGELLQLLCDTASHTYEPRLWHAGVTDFQVTRGMLGISL